MSLSENEVKPRKNLQKSKVKTEIDSLIEQNSYEKSYSQILGKDNKSPPKRKIYSR